MSQLFQELKRRNVFRVAIVYLAVAWLILQVADIVLENVSAPAWVMQVLMLFLAIGFPLGIFFAWAYEMTPEGIKREHEIDRDHSITRQTGRKLDRAMIVVLGLAVLFLVGDRFMVRETSPDVSVTDKSVAVLPFVAMSSGPDDEYFADGLTEEILNSLTRLPQLLVTARTSAFHFKGQDIPIPQIAATLGVAHIVEGSVRRDGERMRVTAQLIRADDGFHLWSEKYDHDTDDAFGVQTDIAEKIATALDIVLDEEQLAKMQEYGIRNPEAFIAYQKGIELFDEAHAGINRSHELLEANKLFEKALELNPGLADAYALHADYFTHSIMEAATGGEMSADEMDHAMAMFIEDHDNVVRFAVDEVRRVSSAFDVGLVSGNWRGLQPMIDKLVELNACYQPDWLDMLTFAYGRAQDHLKLSLRLTSCDPLSFNGWRGAIHAYNWLGEHQAAIDIATEGFRITSHTLVFNELIFSHIVAGNFDQAAKMIDRDVRDVNMTSAFRLVLAAAKGDKAEAATRLDQFIASGVAPASDTILMATISGQRDRANQIAAEIDSRRFGHLLLMQVPMTCQCGAPFDLEYTPNFARLIEEGALPWPPASPSNWPLKDW